jgi:hypothetical protein
MTVYSKTNQWLVYIQVLYRYIYIYRSRGGCVVKTPRHDVGEFHPIHLALISGWLEIDRQAGIGMWNGHEEEEEGRASHWDA